MLLEALERAGKTVDYFALDLSISELKRTLAAIPKNKYKHVRCFGLHGTYEDGLEWMKRPESMQRPRCVLSLGSSIGNFTRLEAAAFLKSFADVLGPEGMMMIGLDGCQDASRVYHAYNDREGTTHEFLFNGLCQANELIGKQAFVRDDWRVVGEYDVTAGRHHAFCYPVKDTEIDGVLVKAGERIRIEESYKYSVKQTEWLWKQAGFMEAARYGDPTNQYRMFHPENVEFSKSLALNRLKVAPLCLF